jgi:hypothetical protein
MFLAFFLFNLGFNRKKCQMVEDIHLTQLGEVIGFVIATDEDNSFFVEIDGVTDTIVIEKIKDDELIYNKGYKLNRSKGKHYSWQQYKSMEDKVRDMQSRGVAY